MRLQAKRDKIAWDRDSKNRGLQRTDRQDYSVQTSSVAPTYWPSFLLRLFSGFSTIARENIPAKTASELQVVQTERFFFFNNSCK